MLNFSHLRNFFLNYFDMSQMRNIFAPCLINTSVQKYKKMERLILLKGRESKERIKKAFGASDMTLSHALTFGRNGEKSQKIRVAAMKNGGKLLCEVTDWNYELLK